MVQGEHIMDPRTPETMTLFQIALQENERLRADLKVCAEVLLEMVQQHCPIQTIYECEQNALDVLARPGVKEALRGD